MDADINASKNIATLGCSVNNSEKSSMYSCALHYSDLKPIPSLFRRGWVGVHTNHPLSYS